MPVQSQNPGEGTLELFICEGVTKRIDRTVEIAEPIRYVVQHWGDAYHVFWTESHYHRENMPRQKTDDEGSQNDGDCPEGFPGPVGTLVFLVGGIRARLRLRWSGKSFVYRPGKGNSAEIFGWKVVRC